MNRLAAIATMTMAAVLVGGGYADAKAKDKPADPATAAAPAKGDARCRDASKHFIKCPATTAAPAAAATVSKTTTMTAAAPAPKPAPAAKPVTTAAAGPAPTPAKPSILGALMKPKPSAETTTAAAAPKIKSVKTAAAPSAIPTAARGSSDPADATAQCKDGAYSHAKSHSGSCAGHGGVAKWIG